MTATSIHVVTPGLRLAAGLGWERMTYVHLSSLASTSSVRWPGVLGVEPTAGADFEATLANGKQALVDAKLDVHESGNVSVLMRHVDLYRRQAASGPFAAAFICAGNVTEGEFKGVNVNDIRWERMAHNAGPDGPYWLVPYRHERSIKDCLEDLL